VADNARAQGLPAVRGQTYRFEWMTGDALAGTIESTVLALLLAQAIRSLRDEWTRRREARVSAQVVCGALLDAMGGTHRINLNPARPVRIPFESYLSRWEREQRALTSSLPPSQLSTVSLAFERLALLAKREAAGDDLRDEIFDSLYAAGQECERARRLVWPLTQSTMQRFRRWTKGERSRLARWREYRRVDRMFRAHWSAAG
jgi:hypothetical protein